jgi:hypothetical protein
MCWTFLLGLHIRVDGQLGETCRALENGPGTWMDSGPVVLKA